MLTELQSRLQVLVQAEPLLVGRPVLVEDKGNLVSELETALAEQSLAVVIAPVSGDVQAGALPRRAAWVESFEVVIHRGLVDGADVPSTVAVLDALRDRLNGAPIDATKAIGPVFATTRHELRENGDGTYARVLTVTTKTSV